MARTQRTANVSWETLKALSDAQVWTRKSIQALSFRETRSLRKIAQKGVERQISTWYPNKK